MRKIVFILMAALVGITAFAQGSKPQKSREEMQKELQEFKMKFLAQEIGLKEDQQKLFFEVYSQYDNEKKAIFENVWKQERKLKKNKNATDADYTALSNMMADAKKKDAELEKKYDKKFGEFLTGKQVFQLKAAEEKFREKMHEMRHKRKPQGPRKDDRKTPREMGALEVYDIPEPV